MAKFFCAIIPPCGANEPPPPEASLCLGTDITPDIRRLQHLVVLLRHKVVQLRQKYNLVVQLDRFPTQNTGWSLKSEAVVSNKLMAQIRSLFWSTQLFCIVFKGLIVSKTFRIPDPLSP